MIKEETSKGRQQHWIYVLGDAELAEKARRWKERKVSAGKAYEVITGTPAGPATGRLRSVANDDVLYVYADGVSGGKLRETDLGPGELAERLRAEGLDAGHREVKVFASASGDGAESGCFAEELYEEMRKEYPNVAVSGYRGKVDAEGYEGHKTAGLADEETLDGMSRDEWMARGSRAREHRVTFPRS